MGLLTKIYKLPNEYQVWLDTELNNGDIIDVYKSLGNRVPARITIESPNGDALIRFNVATRIYKEFGPNYQGGVGYIDGFVRPQARLIDEIEETPPHITIYTGTTQFWTREEIQVRDIKILEKTAGMRIIVA